MSERSIELTILWLLSFGASLTVVAARLGMSLFSLNSDPPTDPEALASWRRRRAYLITSELAALPAFATMSVVATEYWSLSPVASILISMVLGALGFGFLLHAVETLVRRRLDMKDG